MIPSIPLMGRSELRSLIEAGDVSALMVYIDYLEGVVRDFNKCARQIAGDVEHYERYGLPAELKGERE